MSYPPDPNNPYGQPPQQQPPQQYGYPQQQPPASPYGYGSGYPAYPGQAGYPGMPQEMPGMLKAARVILFVMAGLQILGGIIAGLALASIANDSNSEFNAAPVVVIVVVLILGLAALAIIMGVRLSKGAGGVRVGIIIYSAFLLLGGLANLARGGVGVLSAVIGLAIGGVLLASVVRKDASAWFNRPRY